MLSYKKYIIFFVIVLVATILSFTSFIYSVDPYGLYGTPLIKNYNQHKSTAETKVRHIKPYQVERVKPKTLILGNSRPEIGLDPAHQCWSKKMKPVYSLTIPGSSIYMQVRYAQHALAISNIQEIIMGVDFLDSLVNPKESTNPKKWPLSTTSFDDKLFVNANNTNNPYYFNEKYHFFLKSLTSMDSLKDSLYTVISQTNPSTTNRTPLGFNPASDYYRNIIKNEGTEVLFRQKKQEITQQLNRIRWEIFHKNSQWSHYFESLKQLINLSQTKKINLIIFINPYHSDYLNIIKETGYWTKFKRWKTELTKLALNSTSVELWDFNDNNPYSQEKRRENNPHLPLKWFWEPAHYKKELGDLILASIKQNSCFSNNYKYSFGKRIALKTMQK